jgi:hypothetical protein
MGALWLASVECFKREHFQVPILSVNSRMLDEAKMHKFKHVSHGYKVFKHHGINIIP